MTVAELIVRFLLALSGSLLFGLVRQRLGKPIGFGTFTLVALGSCGLAEIAIRFAPDNPLPLLGATVTGVGFLGAGALFRNQDRPVGFTSAATIWAFAVYGLALGLGEFALGTLVYGTIWLVTLIDRRLEQRWAGVYQRRLTIALSPPLPEDRIREELGLSGFTRLTALCYERDADLQTFTVQVSRNAVELEGVFERLRGDVRVRRLELDG